MLKFINYVHFGCIMLNTLFLILSTSTNNFSLHKYTYLGMNCIFLFWIMDEDNINCT